MQHYVLHRLLVGEIDTVEEHLLVCETCQIVAVTAEIDLRTLQAKLMNTPQPNDEWRFMPVCVWTTPIQANLLPLAGIYSLTFVIAC